MVGRRLISCIYSISNKLSARRLLLLSVVRPSLEYGSEVWEGNKSQAAAPESVLLGVVSVSLGALQRHAMRQLGGIWVLIYTLHGHREKAKLKWWYKLVTMSEDRYPKKLFSQDWNIKSHRGKVYIE